MNEFRISKYNPVYRINEIYTRNEWSSCADVGCEVEGDEAERIAAAHHLFLENKESPYKALEE